ncbi:hypothetical protein ACOSQ2_013611 [Xanthoceras sorbifolium]
MADFLVIDYPTAYNAVLGRPALNDIEIFTSIKHLTLKFPTPTGIGHVYEEQKVARSCYEKTVKFRMWEKAAKAKANEQRIKALVEASRDTTSQSYGSTTTSAQE